MIVKSNPLFHDSTVTQGANIQTQFEVTGVTLKDGQAICLKLVVGEEVRCMELALKREGVFHTAAWIEHRKRISYQFFIQTGGDLVQASEVKSTLALHTISEVWKPLETSDWKKDFQRAPTIEKKSISFQEAVKDPMHQEEFLDNLIDKWDL